MKTRSRRKARLARSDKAVKKPTVLTMLGHILTSAFTGEVLWITVPGGALFAYLYVNKVAPTNLLVLLLVAVVVLAFLRGCKEWQKDLNIYHRTLSNLRDRHAG